MSQQQIQPTNLPIYLQNYTVDILDGKKEPKKMGDVFYSTVGAIPSNVPRARVWQMNLTGTLRPTSEKYTILYDFKKVDYENKNIRFENIVSGTFNVCGQVLDASKVIGKNYTFSDEESTLTFTIKIPKLGFRLKKESLFSFNLTIDDDTCGTSDCSACSTSDCSACSTQCTALSGYTKIKSGDTITFANGSATVYYPYSDYGNCKYSEGLGKYTGCLLAVYMRITKSGTSYTIADGDVYVVAYCSTGCTSPYKTGQQCVASSKVEGDDGTNTITIGSGKMKAKFESISGKFSFATFTTDSEGGLKFTADRSYCT